jgi:hypothetical protein
LAGAAIVVTAQATNAPRNAADFIFDIGVGKLMVL